MTSAQDLLLSLAMQQAQRRAEQYQRRFYVGVQGDNVWLSPFPRRGQVGYFDPEPVQPMEATVVRMERAMGRVS